MACVDWLEVMQIQLFRFHFYEQHREQFGLDFILAKSIGIFVRNLKFCRCFEKRIANNADLHSIIYCSPKYLTNTINKFFTLLIQLTNYYLPLLQSSSCLCVYKFSIQFEIIMDHAIYKLLWVGKKHRSCHVSSSRNVRYFYELCYIIIYELNFILNLT